MRFFQVGPMLIIVLFALIALAPAIEAEMTIELAHGEILIRSDVFDDDQNTYVLIAIERFDKYSKTDGVIDQLWLLQPSEPIAAPINESITGSLEIFNDSQLTIRNRDGELIMTTAPAKEDELAHYSLPELLGISHYFDGFERGLEDLRSPEPLHLPFFLAPLLVPGDHTAMFSKSTLGAKAIQECEVGDADTSGETKCTATCAFGNCRAECTHSSVCPCCKCSMGMFPTCSCVSCPA